MPSVLAENYVSFWDFSLQHYARPGVADVCLQLQDERGLNVNLLLWCLWLEECGLELDAVRLQAAQKTIRVWDEHYVIPLRQLRRRMKVEFGIEDPDIDQLRRHIKQAELLAEKQVQMQLESLAKVWLASARNARLPPGHNLSIYLQEYNLNNHSELRSLLVPSDATESAKDKHI